MGSHIRKCLEGTNGGARSRVLLVRAQPAGEPMFWLDIAARPDAKLKDLDGLLRRVWLECCGHLSEFYGGAREKVSMNRRIDEVLGLTGSRLGYVYDFGYPPFDLEVPLDRFGCGYASFKPGANLS